MKNNRRISIGTTAPQTAQDFPTVASCKRNGFKQVNGFLSVEQHEMLSEIADLSGISIKDLVSKMVIDSLDEYRERVEPLVELRRQYEEARASFKIA